MYGLYIIDEKGNIEDIPIKSKELITLRYDDEEDAFKSLSTSSRLIPRDAYARLSLIDPLCLYRNFWINAETWEENR